GARRPRVRGFLASELAADVLAQGLRLAAGEVAGGERLLDLLEASLGLRVRHAATADGGEIGEAEGAGGLHGGPPVVLVGRSDEAPECTRGANARRRSAGRSAHGGSRSSAAIAWADLRSSVCRHP